MRETASATMIILLRHPLLTATLLLLLLLPILLQRCEEDDRLFDSYASLASHYSRRYPDVPVPPKHPVAAAAAASGPVQTPGPEAVPMHQIPHMHNPPPIHPPGNFQTPSTNSFFRAEPATAAMLATVPPGLLQMYKSTQRASAMFNHHDRPKS